MFFKGIGFFPFASSNTHTKITPVYGSEGEESYQLSVPKIPIAGTSKTYNWLPQISLPGAMSAADTDDPSGVGSLPSPGVYLFAPTGDDAVVVKEAWINFMAFASLGEFVIVLEQVVPPVGLNNGQGSTQMIIANKNMRAGYDAYPNTMVKTRLDKYDPNPFNIQNGWNPGVMMYFYLDHSANGLGNNNFVLRGFSTVIELVDAVGAT